MRRFRAVSFNPTFQTLIALGMLLLAVGLNFIANLTKGTVLYYLLYHGVFVLGACVSLPLWYVSKHSQDTLKSIGITSERWQRAFGIGLIAVGLTIPFRIFNQALVYPEMNALIYTLIGLAMASLAEEFFFRGYLQTRFEKAFGLIPAILLSGISFSLYHIGYRDFRSVHELVVLLIVGLLFATVFRITRNVITAFTLNFPHAVFTFLGKGITIPLTSALISGIVIVASLIFIYRFARVERSSSPQKKVTIKQARQNDI